MRVLFTFENPLPAREADAEVFTNTARCIGARLTGPALHVPADGGQGEAAANRSTHMAIIRAWAPLRPAALRHFCCGLTIVFRSAFRKADIVYTRMCGRPLKCKSFFADLTNRTRAVMCPAC